MTGRCRFCNSALRHSFLDLGKSPLANAYLQPHQLNSPESFFPLHVWVCGQCLLVQLEEFQAPEQIFSEYAYYSSYSPTWLEHARLYTELMIERFGFNAGHQIIEIASNDGYLLQYFQAAGIPVLGIEPAANVARVAQDRGIDSLIEFFGVASAGKLAHKGDLILGNNVLAHVPDLNDFVGGLKIALSEKGIITMEFPHLMHLIEGRQFDTIYHEHFSYFSLHTIRQIFQFHGLRIFDVEQIATHGGSLRIFACHDENTRLQAGENIDRLTRLERDAGLDSLAGYQGFAAAVAKTKRGLLKFLVSAKEQHKTIVGYGAPAKGNTMLNYCGIKPDFIDYTVDKNPHKQGTFLPGTHIPVYSPDRLADTQPDYILILPWNLRHEIAEQLEYTRAWGSQLVVAIPEIAFVQ